MDHQPNYHAALPLPSGPFEMFQYLTLTGMTTMELGQAIGTGLIIAGGAAYASWGKISTAYQGTNHAKLRQANLELHRLRLEIETIKSDQLGAQAEAQAIKNENTSLRMQLIDRDKLIVERDRTITEQMAAVHRRDQTIEEQMRLYRRQSDANSAMAEYIMIACGNMRPSNTPRS